MTDLLLTALALWAVVVTITLLELDYATWCSSCHRVVIRTPHDCSRSTRLEAAGADRVAFTPVSQLVAKSSPTTRTISGLVIPWDEYGDTSVGRVVASQGSIRIPDDLTRVKLVDQHQQPPG